jgi:hypothetical protein
MSRISLLIGALLVVAVSASLAADRASLDFEGHTFSLQLPAGYTPHANATPAPGVGTFGFSTEARNDGTRGMIQVTLLDFTQAPGGETVSLEKLAATMIDGVRRKRTRWEEKDGEVQIAGVKARRIEWIGSTEPGFGRPPVTMRGVMIVGIAKDLGFSLHTQDVDAFADTTLPLCEQAMQTFTVALRR